MVDEEQIESKGDSLSVLGSLSVKDAEKPKDNDQSKGNEQPSYEERHKIKASADGWKDFDEFQGDPEKWVDARDYNTRGPLLNKIKNQQSQLDKVDSRLSGLRALHTAQMAAQKTELMKKRDFLIEAAGADVEGIKDIEQQINNLTPALTAATDPMLDQWNTNNPWINEESPKASYAKDIFQREAAIPGNTMNSALTKVNAAIARHYPDKPLGDPVSETGSNPQSGKISTRTLTMADVTHEEMALRNAFPHFKNPKVFLQAITDSRKTE